MRKLWSLAMSLPTAAYAGAGAVLLVTTLWVWHGRTVNGAYERGRSEVLDAARVDSALIALTIEARAHAMARTDTVVDTVRVAVERVRTVHVPDSVRVAFPVVDTLVVESQRLTGLVDTLLTQISTERAAATMLQETLTAQLTEARLVTIAHADTVRTLKKRPTWKKVGGFVLGGIVAGAGAALVVVR